MPSTNTYSLPTEQIASLEDLLRPSSFDWADDAEEELDNLLRPSFFNWADDVEDQLNDDRVDFKIPTGGDEDHDTSDEAVVVSSSESEDEWDNAFDDSHEEDSEEDKPEDTVQPSEAQRTIASMEEDVRREFSFRNYCMMADEEQAIHHFNWLGCPVYQYSCTPPAISLMYMLAGPRIPQPGDEYRLQSMMTRATVFVDPVIVHTEDGWSELSKRGMDLVRYATGRVHKFYSPHGSWINDENEMVEETALDSGDIQTYLAPGMAQGNGFVRVCSVRSRSDWEEVTNDMMEVAQAKRSHVLRGRMNKAYVASPLHQCMAANDLKDENEIVRPSRASLKRSYAMANLSEAFGKEVIDTMTPVDDNIDGYDGFYTDDMDESEDGEEETNKEEDESPAHLTWRVQHTRPDNKRPRVQRGPRQLFNLQLEPIVEEDELTTAISWGSTVNEPGSDLEEETETLNKEHGMNRLRRVAHKARAVLKGRSVSGGSSSHGQRLSSEGDSTAIEEPPSPKRPLVSMVPYKKKSVSKKIKGGLNGLSKKSGKKERRPFREAIKEYVITGLEGMGSYPFIMI